MKYSKPLPPVRYLTSLAYDTRFPASCEDIVQVACSWGFPDTVIDFLNLFEADEIFKNREEFITRCKQVEMLIAQKRTMPEEIIRNPQN